MKGPQPLRLTLLMLAFGTVPLAAQRPPAQSDSLSRPFVMALLGVNSGMGRDFDVRSGVLDDSLPRALFRDAIPLGRSTMYSATTSIAYYPYGVTATVDTLKARLLRDGYREPPSRASRQRGLSTSSAMAPGPAGGRGVEGFMLCGATNVLRVSVSTDPQNRTVAALSSQADSRSHEMACTETGPPEMAMFERMMRSPLPPMTPPRGMQGGGGGASGAAADGGTQHQELYGSVTLPRMQAHYDSLMTAAGWRVLESARGEATATSIYEVVPPDDGRRWRATLVIAAYTGGADLLLLTRAGDGRR